RLEAEAKRLREAAELKARLEAEAKRQREEAEEKVRLEAEAKRLREEAEEKVRLEAEAQRQREEAAEKARLEAEAKRQREEAELKARLEAEAQRQREEAAEKIRLEAEVQRQREEAAEKARLEAEAQRQREEAAEKVRLEAEAAKVEAQRKKTENNRKKRQAKAQRKREEKARLDNEKRQKEEERLRLEEGDKLRKQEKEKAIAEAQELAGRQAAVEAQEQQERQETEQRQREEEERLRLAKEAEAEADLIAEAARAQKEHDAQKFDEHQSPPLSSGDEANSEIVTDEESKIIVQGEHDHPLPVPTAFTTPKRASGRGSHTNVGDTDDFALQDTSQLDEDDAFLYSPLGATDPNLNSSANGKNVNNVVFGDSLSQDSSPPLSTPIYGYPITPSEGRNSETSSRDIKPRRLNFGTSPNELENFEDPVVGIGSTDDSFALADSQHPSPMTITLYTPNNVYQRFLTGPGAIPSSSLVAEESQSTIPDLALSPNSSPSIERLPGSKKHSAKIVLYDVHLTDEMIPPTSEYEQVVHVGLSDLFSAENLSEADPYYFERAEELLLSTFEIVTRDAPQIEIDLGYLGAKHAEPMKEFIKFYYKDAVIIEAKSFPDTPSTPLASQASRPFESPMNYSPSGFDTSTELPPLSHHFQSLPQPSGLPTPIKLSSTPHGKIGSAHPSSLSTPDSSINYSPNGFDSSVHYSPSGFPTPPKTPAHSSLNLPGGIDMPTKLSSISDRTLHSTPSALDTSINYSPNGFESSPVQYSPSGFGTPPNLKSVAPPLPHSSQSLSQPSSLTSSLISTPYGKAGNTTLLDASQSSIVYSPNGFESSPVQYSPSGFGSPVKYSPSGFGSPIQYSPSGFALQVVPIKSPATSPLRDTTSHFQVQISPHKNLPQRDQPPQVAPTAPPKKSFFQRFFGF
ncbi:MAG: hypothetical protein KA112_05120, partial [Alphaproteobacteria bacterium]|nr:hypothetical protein [Alphaproteobacteria bacterium]MBP7729969.1 hypothetical protein [Alphaproteobacteria bacterium]